jgi:hypothetical protein
MMVGWRAPIALLVMVTLLAGCLDNPADDPASGGGNGGDDRPPAGGGNTPAAGGDGGSGPNDPGSNGTGSEPGEDPPSTPTGPAHPSTQRKDSVDEITRPGEYAEREKRPGSTDAQWTVPSWSTGDWWRWKVGTGTNCIAELKETVTGTGNHLGVALYTLRNDNLHCGNGDVYKESSLNRTRAHLTRFAADGYIDHELLFPLADGKRWVYMNAGSELVELEVTHRPAYTFGLETVEAWQITSTFNGRCNENGCDEITRHQWYGVAKKHLLKEEIYVNNAVAPSVVIELLASSYESGSPLPGGIPPLSDG